MITIAQGTDREKEITLKPLIGRKGRDDTRRLMAFVGKYQDNPNAMMNDVEIEDIISIVLGLSEEEKEPFGLIDLLNPFEEALAIRLGQVDSEAIKIAEKK